MSQPCQLTTAMFTSSTQPFTVTHHQHINHSSTDGRRPALPSLSLCPATAAVQPSRQNVILPTDRPSPRPQQPHRHHHPKSPLHHPRPLHLTRISSHPWQMVDTKLRHRSTKGCSVFDKEEFVGESIWEGGVPDEQRFDADWLFELWSWRQRCLCGRRSAHCGIRTPRQSLRRHQSRRHVGFQ